MKSYNHEDAKTIRGAIKLLQNYQGKAKLIAGGTDLLGIIKDRVLPDYPEALINIKTISKLDYIIENSDGLRIGALSRLSDIAEHPVIKQEYRILAEAAQSVATPQIRNMGTIGGNLCQETRCWYYRYPQSVGGRILCHRKGDKACHALLGENQYHSIFGGWRIGVPPCVLACPGNINIPSYIEMIREDDLDEAARILLEANPLPSVTGRVCPHFCEQECNRGEFDESVSIKDIERFMGDYILDNAEKFIRPSEQNGGKSVAIIGSGPAGLTAGYYLAKLGHKITIFEQLSAAGGMMRVGIPRYRLPVDILDREIEIIRSTGVNIKTNIKITSLDELFEQGYKAIFVSTGAIRSLKLGIAGEDSSGVIDCLSFLREVNLGSEVTIGDKVAVVGGGYAAIDAARAARRMGARDVTILYRRSRTEMPAGDEEIDDALEEGVNIQFLTTPYRIAEGDAKLELECMRMKLGEMDNSGRRSPEPVHGSEFSLEFDTIIVAVGQQPEVPTGFGMKIKQDSFATSIDGVFAGGDVVSGPASVIEAISAGKRAALGIDRYLQAAKTNTTGKAKDNTEALLRFNSEFLKKVLRKKVQKRPVSERILIAEDTFGLVLEEITKEANRCFNCSCLAVNSSDLAVALVALDAKVQIAGPRGIKIIPVADFFSRLPNILEIDEIVTEFQVPRPSNTAGQIFSKFRLRSAVDFPIVSVALYIDLADKVCINSRIVLGAVAPIPVRALEAEELLNRKPINNSLAVEVSEAAVRNVIPLKKNDYKVTITKALVKRAILSCV
jgi:NADPH-dependent glutamate synthase beta subunit-like oxidoreductase/CO/xanthine dehydrogenase FAD-binding subunit